MAIDINNRLGLITQNGGKSPEQVRADTASRSAEQTRSSDAEGKNSVKISDDAASLRAMEAKLERQESFDETRVNAIRDAIVKGEYPIDNQRLAEKFLQLESKL